VRVTHVSLDLALDMARREAAGSVTLALERFDGGAPLVLDAQGLAIESVFGADNRARKFVLGEEAPIIGAPLTIELAPDDHSVTVHYRTTARSDALQWLAPEQTTDGKAPFLFTQGQAILTRTWIPLQDSPGIRITYDARIRAPIGLTVVMSAQDIGSDTAGVFRFRMDEAIPPYLIALACGDIKFLPLSKRCGVWAEPSVVAGAHTELSDTESMVQSAEALFGPYRWGRYDLIILPASFPFGGMENPRLTFATPTILAGDKSLVSLVAHELAHSWSGNLVTNATWRDFWLNEGFTVYFEQRIMEAVYGVERANMERELALAELERELKDLAPREQVLHVEMDASRNPDDSFSNVPYTKGALFLACIENVVGRERFDRFLRSYFDSHAFQSITTEQFVAYLKRTLFVENPSEAAKIDLKTWLEQPGLPANTPRTTSESLAKVAREALRFKAGTSAAELDTKGFATQQWLTFLESVADALDAQKMAALDAAFGFTKSGNSEIVCTWLRLSIANGYAPADARLVEFLTEVGRRKFLKPLYTELAKTDAGMKRGREIYEKARPRYHSVSVGTIDKILGWQG
jgi:aminopeptidase N